MNKIAHGTNASPSRILDMLMTHTRSMDMVTYTYIVLGKPGPTGKTWLVDRLRSRGLTAMEIIPELNLLVEYRDDRNHVFLDHENHQVLIVLNQPISKGEQ